MKKKHRIFIAINLPGDIKKYLSGFQKKWSELPARWVNQDNIHITLVFLGYLTDEELGQVCMAVKEVAQRHNSFHINLNKISYGPIEKPRMIWVGGDPPSHKASELQEKSKELSLLKRDLENSLVEKVNFKPENRSFSPHITLARLRQWEWRQIEPEERPEVNENIDVNFTVESIEVMESKLRRNGPIYTIIESHQLK